MSIEILLKLGVAAMLLLCLVGLRLAWFFTARFRRWLWAAQWPQPGGFGRAMAALRRSAAEMGLAIRRAAGAAGRTVVWGGRAARRYVIEPLVVLIAVALAQIARGLSVSWRDGVLPGLDRLGDKVNRPQQSEVPSDLGPNPLGPPA